MFPRLLNSSDQTLAVLDNITSSKVKEIINGQFTFDFSAIEKELKSEFFVPGNKLAVDGQHFDIVAIEKDHKKSLLYNLESEHVAYRLIKRIHNGFAMTGTPTEILTSIISTTEFTVGIVDYTDIITINVDSDTNARVLTKQLANLLGGELEYTNNGFTIGIRNEIGANNGAEVRFGKNMFGITSHYDSRESEDVSYTVDVARLAQTTEYKRLGLSSLETYGLGDTVKVIDSIANIETTQRVLSRTYDPKSGKNMSVELVDRILLISDTIQSIETSVSENSASITVLDGRVDIVAGDVDGNTAQLVINGHQISQNVSDISGNTASINVLSDEIDLKVDADGVISSINISPEAIKISASKIELAGDLVVTSDLTDGTTEISGDNILTGHISGIGYDTKQGSGVYLSIGESGNSEYMYWRDGTTLKAQIYVTIAGDMFISSTDDLFLVASGSGDVTIDGTDVHIYGDVEINGSTPITYISAGTGLSGSGQGPTRSLSIDTSEVPRTKSNQVMEFQYLSGNDTLEVYVGGSYKGAVTLV